MWGALQALDDTLNSTVAGSGSSNISSNSLGGSPCNDDETAGTADARGDPAAIAAAAATAAPETQRLSLLMRNSKGEPQRRINALPGRRNASHVSPAALRALEQRRLAAVSWWRNLRDEVHTFCLKILTLEPIPIPYP
jgi:hypothetical protein